MYYMGSRSPMVRGNFEGGELGTSHCNVEGHSAVICTKKAKAIKMPFGCGLGWVQGITN